MQASLSGCPCIDSVRSEASDDKLPVLLQLLPYQFCGDQMRKELRRGWTNMDKPLSFVKLLLLVLHGWTFDGQMLVGTAILDTSVRLRLQFGLASMRASSTVRPKKLLDNGVELTWDIKARFSLPTDSLSLVQKCFFFSPIRPRPCWSTHSLGVEESGVEKTRPFASTVAFRLIGIMLVKTRERIVSGSVAPGSGHLFLQLWATGVYTYKCIYIYIIHSYTTHTHIYIHV